MATSATHGPKKELVVDITALKAGVASAVAAILALSFGLGAFYPAFVVATLADVLVGTAIAISRRQVVSSVAREGITRKCVQLFIPPLMAVFEHPVRTELGTAIDLSSIASMLLFWVEGLSLIEHLAVLGIKLPFLSNILKIVGDKAGGEVSKDK